MKMLLDKINESGGAGGSGYSATDDGKGSEETATDKTDTPSDKESEDNLDEHGYEIPKEEVKDGEDDKGKKETADKKPEEKSDKEVEDPATGYGEEPLKVTEKKPDEKTDDKAAADDKSEIVLDLKGFSEDQATGINEFVKNNKLSKEQSEAFVELRKKEIQDAEAFATKVDEDAVENSKNIRAGWDKDLRNDADFGGDKFAYNIKQSEKVLAEFLPNTKKALTESKGMLPPYVMKDLATLAKELYGSKELTSGDPTGNNKTESEGDDELDFYKM